MKPISSAAKRGNSLAGFYIYSRVNTPGGYTALGHYGYIERELYPGIYLIASLHIDPGDGVVSRYILSIAELMDCTLYETGQQLRECQEYYFEKAAARRRSQSVI